MPNKLTDLVDLTGTACKLEDDPKLRLVFMNDIIWYDFTEDGWNAMEEDDAYNMEALFTKAKNEQEQQEATKQ